MKEPDLTKIDTSNKKRKEWLIKNNYYDYIMEKTKHIFDISLSERIYILQNKLKDKPVCVICGTPLKYYPNRKEKYPKTKTCSTKCRNKIDVHVDMKNAIEEYNNGKSILEISKKSSISNVTLKKYLLNNDVKLRTHSENQKIQYKHNRESQFPHINFEKLDDIDWIINENKTRSIADIATEIGVAPHIIFKKLKPFGFKSKIHKYSQEENKIEKLLNEYNLTFNKNDRTIIHPLELDFYLPEQEIAIEVNGLYWHSELSGRKDKHYHLNKTKKCISNNIQLLHFWDIEIREKWDIVRSMILSKLGKCDKKIYARCCSVSDIDESIAKEFFNKNHIQGYTQAKRSIALFYKNEIVACMSFGNARFKNKGVELLRFANKLNTTVVGGASKLFSRFKNTFTGEIFTYANLRYSNGNLYNKLGFSFLKYSDPHQYYTKYYTDLHHPLKYSRNRIRKKLEIYNEKFSIWENMKINGYDRIWDCGNLKFSLTV